MDSIVLKNKAPDGELLEATYLPSAGLNLISYKKGSLEIIDQSTRTQFEERFGGLGPLIGPHFHRRTVIPPLKDESVFPHIAHTKAHGSNDPFSHGVGRYAPWKIEHTDTQIKGVLTGKDEWNGIPLASLEGQNFKMIYQADLRSTGLHIEMSVVSDTDSVIGLHYYYHLPNGTGKVISEIQDYYLENGKRKPLDSTWNIKDRHHMEFDLKNKADYTFHPFPNPLDSKILLDAGTYRLMTRYSCQSQENSWQLFHPKNASFVCIEPLSAQDPRHPNLTVSSLKIQLEILN